jgi:hypothetical protein
MERTDQPTPKPTPIPEDLTATATALLERAAADYARSADVRRTMAQQDRRR